MATCGVWHQSEDVVAVTYWNSECRNRSQVEILAFSSKIATTIQPSVFLVHWSFLMFHPFLISDFFFELYALFSCSIGISYVPSIFWKTYPAIFIFHPIGSMYAIYGDIYHQYTPNVSIYMPAPWIRHGHWLFFEVAKKYQTKHQPAATPSPRRNVHRSPRLFRGTA